MKFNKLLCSSLRLRACEAGSNPADSTGFWIASSATPPRNDEGFPRGLLLCLTASILFFAACGKSASSGGNPNPTSPELSSTCPMADNVMPVTVNGSLCESSQYVNQPCVSVTICSPSNPSNCQTVKNILLDTGSYGLRIFKEALTSVELDQVNSGSGSLAECVGYGDGSTEWGPIQKALVRLGGESPVSVPIMVIDAIYPGLPDSCVSPEKRIDVRFNGILGVGLLTHDCGVYCANNLNTAYFSCSGSSCNQTKTPLVDQVQNPVSLLPRDNNGIILSLPQIDVAGSSAVNGCLYFGIGTQPNNAFGSGVVKYPANNYANMTTVFKGKNLQSFIDSGSNSLYFQDTALPQCSSSNSFYCPASTQPLTAKNGGVDVSFEIANAYDLLSNTPQKLAFNNIGAYSSLGANIFDWGLPFFFGKNIYFGISNTAPYFAY